MKIRLIHSLYSKLGPLHIYNNIRIRLSDKREHVPLFISKSLFKQINAFLLPKSTIEICLKDNMNNINPEKKKMTWVSV